MDDEEVWDEGVSGADLAASPETAYEPLVPRRGNGFEAFVEVGEQAPERASRARGGLFDDPLLELGLALSFPELVGERDEAFFEGHLVLVPARVRDAAAGDSRLDTGVEEEALAGGLVLVPRALELVGVEDLPGVVNDHAQANEVCVDGDVPRRQGLEDELRGFADEDGVLHEPGGCAEPDEELAGCRDGEG